LEIKRTIEMKKKINLPKEKPSKLTTKEWDVLKAMLVGTCWEGQYEVPLSEFEDKIPYSGKTLGGILSSLHKKKYIFCFGDWGCGEGYEIGCSSYDLCGITRRDCNHCGKKPCPTE